jgi:hemerythrin-like domain-containing protein
VLACYGGDLGERPLLQMLTQHARLRDLTMRLSDELEQNKMREDTLRSLGELLEAHIRLEERHVFPSSNRPSPNMLSKRWPTA